jgi:tRNA (guanine-N7-)-methyltransferase
MAQENLELNYVGIEVYEAGIGRLINSAHIKQLNNLKVIRGDAVEFLSANIADNSLARFQLFFPDPWHKKKHHKRRIVQQDFLNLLAKKLKIGSVCHMATDSAILSLKNSTASPLITFKLFSCLICALLIKRPIPAS